MSTIGGIIFGLVVGGAVVLLAKSVGAAPGGHPKFKVGDDITYKVPNPLNVIYRIINVFPGPAPGYGTYTMAQVFQGVPQTPVPGYSVAAIDADFVLVE